MEVENQNLSVKCKCAFPSCDKEGSWLCSACKNKNYCSKQCQVEDWNSHKEECPGHLRKFGLSCIQKAKNYERVLDWENMLLWSDVAVTKLPKLNARDLETVKLIDTAMSLKYNALQRLFRHEEALIEMQNIYSLWANHGIHQPNYFAAALGLIESYLHNNKEEEAEYFAREAYAMFHSMTDITIPSALYKQFEADVEYYLSSTILKCSKSKNDAVEDREQKREEAISHARKALNLYEQLYGSRHQEVVEAVHNLSLILTYFCPENEDEDLRLLLRSLFLYQELETESSINVGICRNELFGLYVTKAEKAEGESRIKYLKLAHLNLASAKSTFLALNHPLLNVATINLEKLQRNIQEIESDHVSSDN